MLLRKVQAHQAQGRHLRPLRRRSDARARAPRAHGPHRARRAGLAHLVLQVHAVAHRPDARHDARASSSASSITRTTSSSIRARRRCSKTPAPDRDRISRSAGTVRRRPSSPRWARKRSRDAARADRPREAEQGARGGDGRHQEQADPQEAREAPEARPGLRLIAHAVPNG